MSTVTKPRQYATFRVQDLFLGIEVTKVQEVIRYQQMTPVPLAPPVIRGLINLRGQIVTAFDTRRSLGLPPMEEGSLPINIILQTEDSVVSLLVDDIGDVIDVPLESRAPIPDNMPQKRKDLIESVFDLPEGLMLVLNTAQLLHNACN